MPRYDGGDGELGGGLVGAGGVRAGSGGLAHDDAVAVGDLLARDGGDAGAGEEDAGEVGGVGGGDGDVGRGGLIAREAAALDGASGPRLLWKITLPLLRRTMLFVVVIALINAVQVFEPVAAITQGGPAGSTNTLTYHIRRVGIERTQGGLGSAMAVMLLLALVVSVSLVFAIARRDPES